MLVSGRLFALATVLLVYIQSHSVSTNLHKNQGAVAEFLAQLGLVNLHFIPGGGGRWEGKGVVLINGWNVDRSQVTLNIKTIW